MDVKTERRRGIPLSDDAGWTHEIYRCHCHLTSRFKSLPTKEEKEESQQLHQNLLPTKEDKEESWQLCQNLPVNENGLPQLTGLPV